jgi:hypothetical protein
MIACDVYERDNITQNLRKIKARERRKLSRVLLKKFLSYRDTKGMPKTKLFLLSHLRLSPPRTKLSLHTKRGGEAEGVEGNPLLFVRKPAKVLSSHPKMSIQSRKLGEFSHLNLANNYRFCCCFAFIFSRCKAKSSSCYLC